MSENKVEQKYYAGIGSRKCPPNILRIMTHLAKYLANEGYILRSGGAEGADTAFENGAGNLKEIFRPKDATKEAISIAKRFHPGWGHCNSYVRKLHGRNAQIILGRNLDLPVEKVYCWTPGGKILGGSGMGIKIAQHYNIAVYNLAVPDILDELMKTMKQP